MNWCQELSGEKGMTFSRHKIFPNYGQKQHLDKSLLSMQPEEISVRLNKSLCKQRLFFTVMSKACCLFICVCSRNSITCMRIHVLVCTLFFACYQQSLCTCTMCNMKSSFHAPIDIFSIFLIV